MKVAYIGTYPPRQCGIGTFTNNLLKAIGGNIDKDNIMEHSIVIAMNESDDNYNYPPEVKFTIRQDHQRDYVSAAKFINLSTAKVCLLEHEFGIFGGDMGIYILPLIHRLQVPLFVTFHTVLQKPNIIQQTIIRQIAAKASKLVVMSVKAVSMLEDIYEIPSEKIALIPHGVPAFEIPSLEQVKQKFNFRDKKVLFTFGLISRNKGIETVIEALPPVVAKHPDVLYLVLGNTHPNIIKHSGEEYRNYLIQLAKRNGLEDNVIFMKKFVDEKTLFEYLSAIDIYITPYLNEEQITSGTLSYAVGAGAAVVSTPYWHAQELLAEGRGQLFDFNDINRLSQILTDLLDNPVKLNEIRKKAYEYGRNFRWNTVGGQYLDLFTKNTEKFAYTKGDSPVIDPTLLPKFSLDHIKRLTDDTGIVQHAVYGIPNLKEGYCLDDVSRALIMALMSYRQNRNKDAHELLPIYLSFIHYMQTKSGFFRNFLSFERTFLDSNGSEDSFGRTIWALGYTIRYSPNHSYYQFAKNIFFKSIANFDNLEHLRGIANSLIGISYYLRTNPEDMELRSKLNNLTNAMLNSYNKHKDENWHWFEEVISYDNGILPLALFHSAEITGDSTVLSVAKESTAFLISLTLSKGDLSPIGSEGWLRKGGEVALFAQQSIDVMAIILLFFQAYSTTKERHYIEKMYQSYMWYLGDNELRMPLYDYETKGCCDGLDSHGVNQNQGAESTLAYLISHLTVLKALEIEHQYVENKGRSGNSNLISN